MEVGGTQWNSAQWNSFSQFHFYYSGHDSIIIYEGRGRVAASMVVVLGK